MASRFSDTITAELDALYKKGMVGIGSKYEGLIEMACRRTGLTDSQVQVTGEVISSATGLFQTISS